MKPLQKIEDVDRPEVGRNYMVPCVRNIMFGWENLPTFHPIIGTWHEDADLGLADFHYHYDVRFLSDDIWHGRNGNTTVQEMLLGKVAISRGMYKEKLPVTYRRMRMLRQMPDFPTHDTFGNRIKFAAKLEAQFRDVKMTCMTCPHRGLSLKGLPVKDGAVVCNGHGLKWDIATGRMITREISATCGKSTNENKTMKLIEQQKNVKHVFTPEEIKELDKAFQQAYADANAAREELKSVNKVHKAKVGEAESMQATLHAKVQAGFEYRNEKCFIILKPTTGKKEYYLASQVVDGEVPKGTEPVLVEAMTQDDYQTELSLAEGEFESRTEVTLYEAGDDHGVLIVGKMKDKWYSAIRANVGQKKVEERLDSEQPASKKRCDAVTRAIKRFTGWLENSLSRDTAQGFKNQLALVQAGEAEKVE